MHFSEKHGGLKVYVHLRVLGLRTHEQRFWKHQSDFFDTEIKKIKTFEFIFKSTSKIRNTDKIAKIEINALSLIHT